MDENKIELRLDRERVLDYLSVDDLIALQENQFAVAKKVLARFVFDAERNAYVSEEVGATAIGKLKLRQLMNAVQEFQSAMEGTIVPFPGETGDQDVD